MIDAIHHALVLPRRVRRLAEQIAPLLPPGARVLDCGCGDGRLAEQVLRLRPDLRIIGLDVLVRGDCRIPVLRFDGRTLPFADASLDCALVVDVLHHTAQPSVLLSEVARVVRQRVIVKDHLAEGFAARPTLRFMDRVGNARFGVALPYNYLDTAQWRSLISSLDLVTEVWIDRLDLYPLPLSWLFDRSLHFLAAFRRSSERG